MSTINLNNVKSVESTYKKAKISTKHIIERNYEDLEQIPGFDHFMKNFGGLFDLGGLVAGGFVRRTLQKNSFMTVLELCKKQKNSEKQTDIDFYFCNLKQFAKADEWCKKKTGIVSNLKEIFSSVVQQPTKYYRKKYVASTYFINGYCVNIIVGGEEEKTFKEVISEFDIINCSLAFNKDIFLVDERFSNLESKGLLGLNDEYISDIYKRRDQQQRYKLLERIQRYLEMPEYKNGLDNVFVFRKLLSVLDGQTGPAEYITFSLISKIKEDEIAFVGLVNSYIDRIIETRIKNKTLFDQVVGVEKKAYNERTSKEHDLFFDLYNWLTTGRKKKDLAMGGIYYELGR